MNLFADAHRCLVCQKIVKRADVIPWTIEPNENLIGNPVHGWACAFHAQKPLPQQEAML